MSELATEPKTVQLTEGEPVSLPAVQKFEMATYCRLGVVIGGLAVTYIGPNFLRHFGDVVEESVPARTARQWTLDEWTLDGPITEALGAGAPEAPLASLIQILEQGTEGPGLFNGESNVHYKVSPKDGALWTPHWYVRGNRLGFGALPAGDKVGWEPGDKFFS